MSLLEGARVGALAKTLKSVAVAGVLAAAAALVRLRLAASLWADGEWRPAQ